MIRTLIGGIALALVALPAAAKDRAKVDLTCTESADKLHYNCTVHVMGRKSKQPVTGAKISVKPDMPSMPGAHNIKSIKATPAKHKPGAYKFRMRLDMYGVWALKMTITGPLRDIVVKKIDFRGKDGKMDHKHHKMHKDHKKSGHQDHKKGHHGKHH